MFGEENPHQRPPMAANGPRGPLTVGACPEPPPLSKHLECLRAGDGEETFGAMRCFLDEGVGGQAGYFVALIGR